MSSSQFDATETQSSTLSLVPDDGPSTISTLLDLSSNITTVSDEDSIAEGSYEGIDWNRLKNYCARDHSRVPRRGYIWKKGFEVQQIGTNRIYWVCHQCHAQKISNNISTHIYSDRGGTKNMKRHLVECHHDSHFGGRAASKRPIEALIERASLDGSNQKARNYLVASFKPQVFKNLLVRWFVNGDIAFRQVESKHFRELLLSANPELATAGCLPSRVTLRAWILAEYEKYQQQVKKELASSPYWVHFSFDMWTSGNLLSLCGIVAHYINNNSEYRSLLLGLPYVKGRHSGATQGEIVSTIIREYKLADRVGFFMLDNASNNDSTVAYLAEQFNFNATQRRLRCAGHIINIVAQSILFGKDYNAFELAEGQATSELQQLEVWRNKGPLGKLHNVIVYIKHTDQRIQVFNDIQRLEYTSVHPDDSTASKKIYSLIRDNKTRWNSFYDSIKRAVGLRNAIDEYIRRQRKEWDDAASHYTKLGKPLPKSLTKPTIYDDYLDDGDWAILVEYLSILGPLKDASIALQGRPTEGKHGALWEVLPTMEFLLEHIKSMYDKVKDVPDPREDLEPPAEAQIVARHFRNTLQLGWASLDKYYSKTDDTPIYLAALVLHPAYKWTWIERQWSSKRQWIATGRKAVDGLWQSFRQSLNTTSQTPEQPLRAARRPDHVNTFMQRNMYDSEDDEEADQINDEYARWVPLKREKDLPSHILYNPIAYWQLRRNMYPQLSTFALTVFSIPAMSDDPERVFNEAGNIVRPNRSLLKPDIIAACECIKQWDGAKVIDYHSSERASRIEVSDSDDTDQEG